MKITRRQLRLLIESFRPAVRSGWKWPGWDGRHLKGMLNRPLTTRDPSPRWSTGIERVWLIQNTSQEAANRMKTEIDNATWNIPGRDRNRFQRPMGNAYEASIWKTNMLRDAKSGISGENHNGEAGIFVRLKGYSTQKEAEDLAIIIRDKLGYDAFVATNGGSSFKGFVIVDKKRED